MFSSLAAARGKVPETVRKHYELLGHYGGECIRCGSCGTRCSFGVPIMEHETDGSGFRQIGYGFENYLRQRRRYQDVH
ncbi:hypothetical protein QMP26_15245 [Enterocloster clostridioformis]